MERLVGKHTGMDMVYNKGCFQDILEKLYQYEELEEQELLLRLPCKVGDTIYVINGKDEMEEVVVLNYSANKLGFDFEVVCKDTNEQYYLFDFDFNKDWFLTKAEAEAKLKELKKCL